MARRQSAISRAVAAASGTLPGAGKAKQPTNDAGCFYRASRGDAGATQAKMKSAKAILTEGSPTWAIPITPIKCAGVVHGTQGIGVEFPAASTIHSSASLFCSSTEGAPS